MINGRRGWPTWMLLAFASSLVAPPLSFADSPRVGYRSQGRYARPVVDRAQASRPANNLRIRGGVFGTSAVRHGGVFSPPNTHGPLRVKHPLHGFHGHHLPVVYVPGGTFQEPAPQPEPIVIEAPPPPPPQPIYIVVQSPDGVSIPGLPSVGTPPATAAVPEPAPAPAPRPKGPGELFLSIHPSDAEVYLDDRLLGVAADLDADSARVLNSGVYILQVVHPELKTQRLVFSVPAGEAVSVDVDLTLPSERQRARVQTSG